MIKYPRLQQNWHVNPPSRPPRRPWDRNARAGLGLVVGGTVPAVVGGTFLGTVLLTQRLARTLHPHQGPRLSAALIALYSLTQLAGPWLTGIWLNMGGTLHSAFWLGAGALLWGLLWMLMVPRRH